MLCVSVCVEFFFLLTFLSLPILFFPSFFSTSYLSSIFIYLYLHSTPSSLNLIHSTNLHYLHLVHS
jgi:hypothetical protein